MSPLDLPDDLADLERRLAQRHRPEPAGDLRRRVLAAVRAAGSEGNGFWRFAAAVAAAALLAINLSMSVAADTDWHLGDTNPPPSAHAVARRLQEVLPDLPPDEARRQALLQAGRSRLTPTPPLPVPDRGTQRWLTR
jgi:hypothetical protein